MHSADVVRDLVFLQVLLDGQVGSMHLHQYTAGSAEAGWLSMQSGRVLHPEQLPLIIAGLQIEIIAQL